MNSSLRPAAAATGGARPNNTARATPAGSSHAHGLTIHPLPLATTHGISTPAGTEMFHFPASPPAPYELQTRVTPHNGRRVPPFGNPRITARKPAPRGISQATASFIGPRCQGIHRTLKTNEPINTQHTQVEPQQRQIAKQQYRCSRPLCSSQPTRPQPPTPPRRGAGGPDTRAHRPRTRQHATPIAPAARKYRTP